MIILSVSGYYLRVSGRGFALHHEDDAQYYAKTAQQLFQGRPFTFDGIEPTNGFHPLWVLLLQPLCALTDDPETFVRAVFILQYALFLASAVVLYRLLCIVAQGARGVAGCLTLYYGVDNYFYKTVINGLETPLFVLLALWALLAGLRRCDAARRGAGETSVALAGSVGYGLLLAALALSRLDGGGTHAVALVVGSALLSTRARLVRVAASGAAAVLPVGAYLLLAFAFTGAWLPVSGQIKALRAAGAPRPSLLAVLDFPSMYNFDGAAARALQTVPLDGAADAIDPGYRSYYLRSNGLILGGAGLSIAVFAVYVGMRRRWRLRDRPELALLSWFVFSSAGLLFLNKHVYGYRSDLLAYWYPITVSIAQLLMLGYILGRARAQRRPWMLAIGALILAGFLLHAWRMHADRRAWLEKPHGYVQWFAAARWLRDNTPPAARVAAFNAGILGHFSQRAVINLDGLVNSRRYFDEVLRASYERPAEYRGRLIAYLRGRGVEYFADHAPIETPDCWRAHLGDGRNVTMTEVFRSPVSDGYFGVVYRLTYPG